MGWIRERPERRPSREGRIVGVLAVGTALGLAFLTGDLYGYRKAFVDECVSRNMERLFLEYSGPKPSSEERAAYFSDTNVVTRELRGALTDLCEKKPTYVYPLRDGLSQKLD